MKKKTIIFFAEKEENMRHFETLKHIKLSGCGIWCQLSAFDNGEAFSNVGAWMLKLAAKTVSAAVFS